jgi:hypothetical protein
MLKAPLGRLFLVSIAGLPLQQKHPHEDQYDGDDPGRPERPSNKVVPGVLALFQFLLKIGHDLSSSGTASIIQ